MISDTQDVEIAALEPRMGDINVTFKVLEKSDAKEVTSRRDGSTHRVADAVVGDGSGTVVVPLWDDSIENIEVGKTYTLTNAHTGLFRGNLRLKFGRESELKEAEEEIEEVNVERDMSEENHRRPRQSRGTSW
ncbi:hypothetical protein EU538_02300 [Candidatus Thorarchaeota archaeon]|jgi:replication factor A1|nr:MAG: hypothetical protein EU538_02300 [Candidatus Thorarchaeota archaeon]